MLRANKMEDESVGCLKRRAFIKMLTLGSSAGALSSVLALGCEALIDAAPVYEGETNQAQQLVFRPLDIKSLSHVGGAAIIRDKNKQFLEDVLVIRDQEENYLAYSAFCTHVGCPLGYHSKYRQIECPCHGARFDLEGRVTRGPARSPLYQYRVLALSLDTFAILGDPT